MFRGSEKNGEYVAVGNPRNKRAAINARDSESVEKGLEYIALKNAAQLISSDLKESMNARFEKRKPVYSRL